MKFSEFCANNALPGNIGFGSFTQVPSNGFWLTPTITHTAAGESAAIQLSPSYTAANGGTIYGIAVAPLIAAGSGTVTTFAGIRSEPLFNSSGATFTNCYGLQVDEQTVGTTVNRSIYVTGGTSEFVGTILSGEIRIGADTGGQASRTSFTGTSDVTANSSGVGTIKFKGTTSRDSAGFIKIYIGTTAYFIPVFTAISG